DGRGAAPARHLHELPRAGGYDDGRRLRRAVRSRRRHQRQSDRWFRDDRGRRDDRRRGSNSAVFGLHVGERKLPALGARIPSSVWRSYRTEEAANLSWSSPKGLKFSEAEQREPMWMALAGHYFARALAVALGTSAAHEAPVVE